MAMGHIWGCMTLGGGRRRYGELLEVVDGSGWPSMAGKMAEKWHDHSAARNRARAVLSHFGASFSGCGGCPWRWRCWGIPREAGGGSGWSENGWKAAGKSARIRHINGGVADRGRGFELIFGSLLDSIKIKHGPDFIVNIVSFQLIQKFSNLVMFWLPKNTLKLN